MLYLGIDQHKRQVSTGWEKVRTFFADLAEKAKSDDGFMAILEVCGMNPRGRQGRGRQRGCQGQALNVNFTACEG